MKGIITWTFLLFLSGQIFSQTPVFKASADALEIVKGGYVEVSFTLYNAEGSNFQPPIFNGFKLISGPSRASQISIVNGKTSQQLSFSYTLYAMKEGRYRVGSASIRAGNRRLATKPFDIKVVKGREIDKKLGEDGLPTSENVFVRAELQDSFAFIGQQINLSYKLYTTEDIQSYDITSQPEFDGFYVENVKDYRNSFKREVIDGVQYRTRVLKTYALFPQRTGVFEFDPMLLRLGIPFKDKNSRSFFFNTKVRPMPVETNPVKIEVGQLPENAPQSFSGAVGSFDMRAFINKRELSTDDALVITMNVSGDGDGRKVSYPKFKLPPEFEQYDPKVSKDENVIKNGKIQTFKTFEFVAVPLKEGQYVIEPEFSFFDTAKDTFIILKSGPFRLNITKGTRPKSKSHSFISGIESLEMKPPMTKFTSATARNPLFGGTFFWGISSVFMLSFLSIIGLKVIKTRHQDIDPLMLRKENANKLALAKLEKAQLKISENNERGFYEEIALGFWGYASDKLNIDTSEISKEVLSSKLKSLEVDEEVVNDYISVLQECEKVNYAGVANTDMNAFYQHCLSLISSIEEQLSKVK